MYSKKRCDIFKRGIRKFESFGYTEPSSNDVEEFESLFNVDDDEKLLLFNDVTRTEYEDELIDFHEEIITHVAFTDKYIYYKTEDDSYYYEWDDIKHLSSVNGRNPESSRFEFLDSDDDLLFYLPALSIFADSEFGESSYDMDRFADFLLSIAKTDEDDESEGVDYTDTVSEAWVCEIHGSDNNLRIIKEIERTLGLNFTETKRAVDSGKFQIPNLYAGKLSQALSRYPNVEVRRATLDDWIIGINKVNNRSVAEQVLADVTGLGNTKCMLLLAHKGSIVVTESQANQIVSRIGSSVLLDTRCLVTEKVVAPPIPPKREKLSDQKAKENIRDKKQKKAHRETDFENLEGGHGDNIPVEDNSNKLFDSYTIQVSKENVGEILAAGKSGKIGGIDLSILGTLIKKEKELEEKKAAGASLRPSELGSVTEIESGIQELNHGLEGLRLPVKNAEKMRENWDRKAYPLFVKACRAERRILFGNDNYSIAIADENNRAGVYTTTKSVASTRDMSGLPEDIAQELVALSDGLQITWKQHLGANSIAWRKMERVTGEKNLPTGTSLASFVDGIKNDISTAEKELKVAREYEAYKTGLDKLEAEVTAMRRQAQDALNRLSELDPILTAFDCGDKDYDAAWIEKVKTVAEVRKAMPYLPLTWNGAQFGTVFNWQKAVEDGKPNLFIEAATDEGLDGRMDMLDNFLATTLLAFPAKSVHVTVLENRTVNSFIGNLPEKICQVYDAVSDTEAIRSFSRQLKDMYRAGRDNPSPDCCPREIVVIAGFEKRDRVFSRLMEELNDIIENGRRAGIYFAVVLAKDITEYDWADTDANDFEKTFTPYSTILTEKKDKEGNPIPNYNLLRRDAEIPTEDGEKIGSLAELVAAYLTKGASTVPNKVYEGIENGEMYTAQPITSLDDQRRSDKGRLVVPVAQSDAGEVINMNLDDGDYRFYFILGRSGSGKSFTLHTILTNLMLKYDPSTVEVILMDFKSGGVELNYYKDVPHVSSLLVDGADKQVAYEILLSLKNAMRERGELFQKSGHSTISRYNEYAAKNGLPQMKHIVLLADECQHLFTVEDPSSENNIITMLAREGRTYGIHMVLATQTLEGLQLPKGALKQFSDFFFMACNADDVMKCEINDREVQSQVDKLAKGEIIYCHRGKGSEPVHGYVYNYFGKGGEYAKKTQESLLSSRFSRPEKKQFYFNASQIYQLDNNELRELTRAAKSGLKVNPMAVLGKNLSVKADTLYSKMGRTDGANLLILGANDLLQAERVLWNAVVSLYECNKAIGNEARYYILPNIPEDVESSARDAHEARMDMLRNFADQDGVEVVDEDERAEMIERVAATIRGRQQLAEADKKAVNGFDSIYLVIPNQQLFYTKMGRQPRGLASLDSNMPVSSAVEETVIEEPATPAFEADALGFEGLMMPGSEPEQSSSAPDFMDIDFGSFDSPAASAPAARNIPAGKPGRDFDEELRYILEYGPAVKVHVLLQSSGPDKIYSGDSMREKEMTLLFNDIVFLRMLQAGSMSLPIDSRIIEKLSAEPKSLRAIAYNGSRGAKTIVPFDFGKY